jgi:HPt (histidine-containing phosphotransfer) domain-containing protein
MDDHLAKPTTPTALALALSGLGNETIDARRLALLGAGRAGHDLVAELIDMFVRSIPVRVGGIREAIELDDAAGLRFVAHSLRGSAANLGAEALSRACNTLEELAVDGRMADARQMVDTVVAELDAARDALLILAPR